MGVRRHHFEKGQMTIELAVALPVLIIVAVITVNALTFFGQCAVFDRVANEAVRVHAASPAYGQGADQSCGLVEQEIQAALDAPNVEVSVTYGEAGFGFERFVATLDYHPTLFGLGLQSEVFGVALPTLTHSAMYTVDVYKAGVVV